MINFYPFDFVVLHLLKLGLDFANKQRCSKFKDPAQSNNNFQQQHRGNALKAGEIRSEWAVLASRG